MTRVALVVVSHETRDDALACLASLDETEPVETVLVDAGSTDDTVTAVGDRFPGTRTLRLANVGYGQAANAGVSRTTAPVVVLANADVRFTPGALGALADTLEAEPRVGLLGPRVRYPDGAAQASARRVPTFREAVGHALFGLWWPDNRWTTAYRHRTPVPPPRLPVRRGEVGGSVPVDWVSGCVVAVRRDAFDEVAGFDPDYFMYVEDVDIAHRMRRAGWEVRFDPRIEVSHRVGAATRRYRGRLAFAHARSLHRFYAKAYRGVPHRLLSPAVGLGLRGWATMAWLWQRFVAPRAGRSTTGERK